MEYDDVGLYPLGDAALRLLDAVAMPNASSVESEPIDLQENDTVYKSKLIAMFVDLDVSIPATKKLTLSISESKDGVTWNSWTREYTAPDDKALVLDYREALSLTPRLKRFHKVKVTTDFDASTAKISAQIGAWA